MPSFITIWDCPVCGEISSIDEGAGASSSYITSHEACPQCAAILSRKADQAAEVESQRRVQLEIRFWQLFERKPGTSQSILDLAAQAVRRGELIPELDRPEVASARERAEMGRYEHEPVDIFQIRDFPAHTVLTGDGRAGMRSRNHTRGGSISRPSNILQPEAGLLPSSLLVGDMASLFGPNHTQIEEVAPVLGFELNDNGSDEDESDDHESDEDESDGDESDDYELDEDEADNYESGSYESDDGESDEDGTRIAISYSATLQASPRLVFLGPTNSALRFIDRHMRTRDHIPEAWDEPDEEDQPNAWDEEAWMERFPEEHEYYNHEVSEDEM